ncbi:MAG: ankyrin repeat domain-containing protein [Acidobacteria bacterium]|nr:ankyrin repeat domain-containing protein [Acidobacteriota bacterium]
MTKTKLTLLIALKSFLAATIAMAISLYISLLTLPFPSIFDPDKNPNPPILWSRLFITWTGILLIIGLVAILKNKFVSKQTTSNDSTTPVQPLLSAWVIFLMVSIPSGLLTMRITSIFSSSLRSHINYHMTDALNFNDPATLIWLLVIADIKDGRPLVNQAIQSNSEDCIKVLDLVGFSIPKESLPLLMIQGASTGNNNMIKLMMDYGIDVNLQTSYGQTPLISATEQEKLATIEFLIKSGANINLTPKNSYPALIVALLNDNNEILKTMVKAGADVKTCKIQKEFSLSSKVPNENGEKSILMLPADSLALMLAAASANSEAVKILLSAGVSPNETNSINYTALMYAKASGCIECQQALTEAGAK